ncbi:MAG: AAA family ATPase [Bacteroidales bacterium]|nr:AAA family ATPase [Bacteroidales bacterium]
MEGLINTYRSYLERTDTTFVRYLHDDISWNARLIGLHGARGVGKTTLILQHIKLHDNPNESLFVMADDFYFADHSLIDLARTFHQQGGKTLYIDEVHKYPDWSRHIKNIYDQFPNLKVVYTGSNLLALERGGGDLSRRALRYTLPGLSFREYLALKLNLTLPRYSLNEVISGKVDFPMPDYRPLQWFSRYLQEGYYPFFLEGDFRFRLDGIIKQTVEYDIPLLAQMETASVQKLRKLLYMLAQNVPFKPNLSKLERDLDIRRSSLPHYFNYLEKANLINTLWTKAEGMKLLEKIDKIYLNNPNIAYLLAEQSPNIGTVRETIFLAWLQVNHFITSSKVSDFEVDGLTFEIGGKGKGGSQVENIPDAYIVKDDLEYAYRNIIPLWHFGFLY